MGTEGEAKALEVLEEYKSIFTDGRFYLEIQDNGLPDQAKMNPLLIALARRTGTPLVATNDCHYLNPGDDKLQEILLCLQTGKTISDPTRMRFGSDQFYVKTAEEFERAFGHAAPDALANTLAIAERCNVKIELGVNKIPEIALPPGVTADGKLREMATAGLVRRLEERSKREGELPQALVEEYRRRLAYELSVIEKTGFASYFLIVADFIGWAKDEKIPVGPGRGSAAGSLVAFCVRITEVDSIRYKLLFERFLNPERVSLPDIDCDFCKNRREEVIAYVQRKYGEENVAQLITFGTWKPRGAVRDVGRVLEMPYAEVDRIAKMIPADLKMTVEDALKAEPRFREMIDANPKIADLFRFAGEIEGRNRHAGTHASAVVIANRPITDYCPLYRQATGEITTQYGMDPIARVGLVKFDFLGLRTLTAIDDTLKLLKELRGIEIDPNALELTDAETYEVLGRGDTVGVFQAESAGFTQLVKNLKPDQFNHLIDLVALYRPGPLQSGMAADFVERRHGRRKVEFAPSPIEGDPRGHVRRHRLPGAGDGDRQGAGRVHAGRGRRPPEGDGEEGRRPDGAAEGPLPGGGEGERDPRGEGGRDLRPDGAVRRVRLQQVPQRRVRPAGVPDRVPQDALPRGVFQRPDDLRVRGHRQDHPVHRVSAGRRGSRSSRRT